MALADGDLILYPMGIDYYVVALLHFRAKLDILDVCTYPVGHTLLIKRRIQRTLSRIVVPCYQSLLVLWTGV